MTYVNPSDTNFAAFKNLPRDTPIQMFNLVRYRKEAAYPEDHPNHGKGWSGDEAYREYGKTSGPIFARVGGKLVWRGRYETVLTGPDDEHWDAAFIAEYPDAAAFFEMITDAEYQKAVVNRTAAVEDSRLIRFAKSGGGEGFS
ncbi:DUF1330 domain-containing protein [Pseudoblastomonas halimionae]|uniref:DUF1330 domain-containing protein n=1 Tax=Alteriqipengyuania halimionae TaxID=1926630 RepID=A0A6I4U1Q9_9SPHN|nr:DUF1330 domain-containing protein [Alteriqipengyuania halimionae]MXP09656.1 DUF1330 domain-containing protein [Alteriqipengyuania halimionae]